MAMLFYKALVGFKRHPKVLIIKQDYKKNYNDILMALHNLWSHCMENNQDGVLRMSLRKIALAAEWKGDPKELIKILTNEDTNFIDWDEDEKAYRMHNWYKHNDKLNPERQKNVSQKARESVNTRWLKRDNGWLKKNNINIDNCKWLNIEDGNMDVMLEYVPKYMHITDEKFYSKSIFDSRFRGASTKLQGELLNAIKEHTKVCVKCGKLHVDQELDKCYGCQDG